MTAAVALLVLVAQATSMQIVPPPPRDVITQKGTATVKGKIVAGDTGRVLRRVQVSLSSPDLTESRSMSTTAQGVFEFKELPAGRYTLSASRAGFLTVQYGQRRVGETGRPLQVADGQQLTDLSLAMPRTGAIAGRVTDELGEPLANVSVFPAHWRYFRGRRRLVRAPGGASFNRTDETGQYRITGLEPGQYYVIATTRDTWTVDENPKERIGFNTTYSGGTTNPAEALAIKVVSGQEAAAPDFSMAPGRVASISGTVTTSAGLPLAGESIEMSQEFMSPSGSATFGLAGTKVNPDGTFTIKSLAPGEYRLTVRRPADKERALEGTTMMVVVNGEDLAGITLVTGSGGTITGRVIADTGVALPAPDQRMRISTRPLDAANTFTAFSSDNGRVKDDWTFDVKDVIGRVWVSAGSLPSGWAVRSIDYQGKDLADSPLEVSNGQHIDGVTIVLSKTLPKLSGTLLDDSQRPADGSVLIFPEDSEKWEESSRLIRTARPDTTGAFELRNMIPGDYLAVPVEFVRQGDWSDPEFLRNLKDQAQRVQVGPNGVTGLTLTLKKPK